MAYDVVIIGAGVVGSLIARTLSQYALSICVVERNQEPAEETSAANSGIVHAGYDAKPGSLKARLNVRGAAMMPALCRGLDVPFRQTGSLVLAFDEEEERALHQLLATGVQNGVEGLRILSRAETRAMEPHVDATVQGALYAPSAGIVCPYELTQAALESACTEGVGFLRRFAVTAIARRDATYTVTAADGRALETRYVINAAGVYADKIAQMIGDTSFSIRTRKGEYVLFEKNDLVSSVLFQTPHHGTKGVLVSPTVDGNIFVGPNASYTEDSADVSTTPQGLSEIMETALRTSQDIRSLRPITNFAGLRAESSTHDFVIGSPVQGFFHAAGIESPGLSSSPAIAEYVVQLMQAQGILLQKKTGWKGTREKVIRFRELTLAEKAQAIADNSEYGQIVCRCEQITEAEIRQAIRRPAGATTVDGVKRRTRAGMGRCQGGFCSPRVMEILAQELGCPMERVTKSGGNSYILVGTSR